MQVNRLDLLLRGFNLSPSIDFESQMLLDNIGVSVPDADGGSLLNNVELIIIGHHLDTTVLVANDALSNTIQATNIIISAPLANDSHRVNS